MYTVTIHNADQATVVHSRFERLAGAKVAFEVNATATLAFSVYPNNPGYELLTEFATTVEVVRNADGKDIYEGRVLQIVPTMDEDGLTYKSVTCEGITGGMCCYLHDSTVGYMGETLWEDTTTQTGLERFLDHLLSNHRSRTEESKWVYLGDVDVDTHLGNDQVYKALNFETTYDTITDKLIDVYGGEVRVRRGSDGLLYLDYKQQLGTTKDQPVRIASNMRSASLTPDYSSLVTRLYPRGAKLTKTDEDGNEKETEERLDISSVNAGKQYLDDADGVALRGIVEGVIEWDDVTEPLNLKTKGEQWLAENRGIPTTVSVTAYDLSLLGYDYSAFAVGDWYHIHNDLIGLDETLEILKQTLDISEPEASTIEFGEYSQSQSRRISEIGRLGEDVRTLKSESRTTRVNLDSYVKETMTAIEVGDAAIRSEVSEKVTAINNNVGAVSARVTTVEQTSEGIRKDITELKTDVAATIDGVDVEYAQNQSTTTAPTEGWSSSAPAYREGYYIWQRTKTSFTSGDTVTSAATCISGRNGADGKSVTIKGTLDSAEDLPATGETGDAYLIDGDLWVWDGSAWRDVGQIQGPKGDTGDKGARGSAVWTTATEPYTKGTDHKYRWSNSALTCAAADAATPEAGDLIYYNSYYLAITETSTTYSYADACYNLEGADGKSAYVHFAYCSEVDTAAGVYKDFSTSPFDGATWLGTYSDNTDADPTTPDIYAWSVIQGDDGVGVTDIAEEYYLSDSPDEPTGGSWQDEQPAWVSGKYIWTRSRVTWTTGETTYTEPINAQALNAIGQIADGAAGALVDYYKKTEVDEKAGELTATLREGYEGYTDGKVGEIDTQIAMIKASVSGLETTVADNRSEANAKYGTCATVGTTSEKIVVCNGFKLTTGAMVTVRFTYAHSASAAATLNVNSTGAKTAYIGTSTVALANANTWEAGQTVTWIYDGTYWRAINSDSYSKISQLSDSITLKVSKGDISSQLSLESGAVSITSNRFSWTSTYSSLTKYGVLTCKSGTIGGFTISSTSISNKVMTLNSSGLTLKLSSDSTSYTIGLIGTNYYSDDSSKRGLVFDLEYASAYMAWSAKESSSASSYTFQLLYAHKAFGNYSAGTLNMCATTHFWANIYAHNWKAYNLWIDPSTGGANGGISGSFSGWKVPTAINSSGTVTSWKTNVSMTFKNGFLTSASW